VRRGEARSGGEERRGEERRGEERRGEERRGEEEERRGEERRGEERRGEGAEMVSVPDAQDPDELLMDLLCCLHTAGTQQYWERDGGTMQALAF